MYTKKNQRFKQCVSKKSKKDLRIKSQSSHRFVFSLKNVEFHTNDKVHTTNDKVYKTRNFSKKLH